MRPLEPFDYQVLALIGQNGATPYEVEQACRSDVGVMLGRSRSHLYATPARLAHHGLVTAEPELGSTRERKRYSLTAEGIKALWEWIATPTPTPALEEEVFARLSLGDQVHDDVLLKSLLDSRPEIENRLGRLRELERKATRSPATRHDMLAIQLKIDLLEAYGKWLPKAKKELSPKRSRKPN